MRGSGGGRDGGGWRGGDEDENAKRGGLGGLCRLCSGCWGGLRLGLGFGFGGGGGGFLGRAGGSLEGGERTIFLWGGEMGCGCVWGG